MSRDSTTFKLLNKLHVSSTIQPGGVLTHQDFLYGRPGNFDQLIDDCFGQQWHANDLPPGYQTN